MKTIVIPLDFSNTDTLLIEKGIRFAKDLKAKVFLIHVDPEAKAALSLGEVGFVYFPEIEENTLLEEEKEFNKLKGMFSSSGLECEYALKQGNPLETILNYANEKKADYIVIGSHGRSSIHDVLIGSLTKSITRRSSIPVLVIPCPLK